MRNVYVAKEMSNVQENEVVKIGSGKDIQGGGVLQNSQDVQNNVMIRKLVTLTLSRMFPLHMFQTLRQLVFTYLWERLTHLKLMLLLCLTM